ncbi:MAG: hypothetical protein MUF48_15195 [Pirellulaceae bacterium]|nr:hypothetical protein [Pirellulaceae bacterium]
MKSRKGSAWTGQVAARLRQALAPLAGSGRGVIGIVVVLLLFVIGTYVAWAKFGGDISRRSQYLLTVDSFEITPTPPWIRTDIRAQVMRDGSLSTLSVLDPDLTKRVVQAFELNAWVAEAVSARKRPGDTGPQVFVELRYREPVIMVRTRDPRWKGDCFWPVDTEGVFLPPEDFSASQTRAYLRVEAGNTLPAGGVGMPYGDPAVSGAAKIASVLKEVWAEMGLEWILVRRELPHDVAEPPEPLFVLLPLGAPIDAVAGRSAARPVGLTPSGVGDMTLEVRWGHAPGREAPGEASAAEKCAHLSQLVLQHGRLDRLPPSTLIDLRSASGPAITDTQATRAAQR